MTILNHQWQAARHYGPMAGVFSKEAVILHVKN